MGGVQLHAELGSTERAELSVSVGTLHIGGAGQQNSVGGFFCLVFLFKMMTIECITMPQTTTRFTVLYVDSLLGTFHDSQVITNAARLYTSPPGGAGLNALTHQE
ncbi:hypothetical protein FQA47_013222 [Oryzias melastigma]|uniref:Uncharacterized protein n=1 Tax=Oryzias melastigma TaxID=30732 RepID=A0A834KWP8_ORYME|nr:hypothetical protein FQA47_013222 [Oryzias melastigma]